MLLLLLFLLLWGWAGPSITVEHTLTVVGQTGRMGNISWHDVIVIVIVIVIVLVIVLRAGRP